MSYPSSPYSSQPYTEVVTSHRRIGTLHLLVSWLTAVLTAGYMLPWAVAATRNKTNTVLIAVINVALGWSVIGWIVALIMACSGSNLPVLVVHSPPGPPGPAPRAV